MQCFPQLQTGASGQYPIRKRRLERTIRNLSPDGREIKFADAGALTIEWQLNFEELTDAEKNAVEGFYQGMEGSLGTFTFLDPTDNLFAWSEKLDEAVWEKDPLLQITAGITDPLGTTRASRMVNSGGASQRLVQTLNVPASYFYCLSLYARSDAAGQVNLVRGAELGVREVQSQWSRLTFASASASTDNTAAFGIEIPAGGSTEIFGMQVEAQIGASLYKKTTSRGGVYASARFRNDELRVNTVGPGRHGCAIAIRTT